MPKCAGIFDYESIPISYLKADITYTELGNLNKLKKRILRAIMFGHRHRYTRKERILYTLKQLRKRGCICYTKQSKQVTQMK